jgi:hypothetical protein
MPEYVLVSEDKHDRNLKEYFRCSGSRARFYCRDCHYYVGCLRTRLYAQMGWIFNPQNNYYLSPEGKVVKQP